MIRDALLTAFAEQLSRAPDEPRLLSGREFATAASLDALAREVAGDPALDGVEPGGVAGMIAENGAGFLGLLLGLRRRGLTVLLFDRRATRAEVERACERFPIRAIARCATGWPRGAGDWRIEPVATTADPIDPRLTVIKLTSGSTGEPRGAGATAEALLADEQALAASMGIRRGETLLATLPFSHSYGFASLVLPALVGRNRLVLPDAADPFAPLRAAREHGATFFPTVPAYLDALLRAGADPASLGDVRRVVTAGARLHPETARRFRQRFGQPAHVFYGASECGGITFDREGDAAERGEVGEAIDGVRIELLRDDAEMEAGCGRVIVHSPAVLDRYLPNHDDRLGGGRFVTDDLGQIADGRLTLVGRLGSLINVRGKKVNPAEVEQVIAEQPGVDEVRVLGMEGEGSSGQAVHAFVACAPGQVTEEDVRRWCLPRLTDFKVPRRFVMLERLPRNDRGKVDRRALEEMRRTASRR